MSMFSDGFGGRRRKVDDGPARLNITSMMDMFTIMLIFLLLNFAPDTADLKLDTEMTLPASSSERPYEESIKVALTRNELLVGDDVVARVVDGQFDGAAVQDGVLLPLRSAMMRQRAKIDSPDAAVVVFYADKDAEFTLVDQVMQTAAASGFPNFKFAVNGS